MQYPFIKSFSWYASDFFLKIYIIMHLLLNKWNLFVNEISSKKFNLKKFLDLIDGY
jgi:hypothetical protein